MLTTLQVPFLKPSEIESAVMDLLRRYSKWKGAVPRPPIDIEDLTEHHLGVVFEMDDLSTWLPFDDVLGAAWFEDNIIRVDSSLEAQEGRLYFTLAHEVGHWWLHRPIIEMEKVTMPLFPRAKDVKATPAVVCRRSQRKERAEIQANQFAAHILMPASDVRATVKLFCGNNLPVIDGMRKRLNAGQFDGQLRDYAAEIMREGNFTNVSKDAMSYRLVDLKLVLDKTEHEQQPSLI